MSRQARKTCYFCGKPNKFGTVESENCVKCVIIFNETLPKCDHRCQENDLTCRDCPIYAETKEALKGKFEPDYNKGFNDCKILVEMLLHSFSGYEDHEHYDFVYKIRDHMIKLDANNVDRYMKSFKNEGENPEYEKNPDSFLFWRNLDRLNREG